MQTSKPDSHAMPSGRAVLKSTCRAVRAGGLRRGPYSRLALAVFCTMLAASGAAGVRAIRAAGADSGSVAGMRDMAVEAAEIAACLSGPDAMPAPAGGLTAAMCLDRYDYNDDSDVDLDDFRVYLATLPFFAPPVIELGDAHGQPYRTIEDGDTIDVHPGAQGFMHVFISLRGFGYLPWAEVLIERQAVLVSTGEFVVPVTSYAPLFPPHGVGVNQITNSQVVLITLPPGQAEGEALDITFTVEMVEAPITATVTRRVILHEVGG